MLPVATEASARGLADAVAIGSLPVRSAVGLDRFELAGLVGDVGLASSAWASGAGLALLTEVAGANGGLSFWLNAESVCANEACFGNAVFK